jgi:ABC-type multidrug transport system fused ATPase/permease subunit
MPEIPKIIFTFLKNKWVWVFPAFVSNILNSCINASILLSIGKYINLINQEKSAKTNIFDSIFGKIESTDSMFKLFLVLVLLKAVFTFLDNFLSQFIGNSFITFVRIKSVESFFYDSSFTNTKDRIKRLSKTTSTELNSIKDLVTKGSLELISDVSYMIIIAILVYSFNSALLFNILIALPLFGLISFFLGSKSSNSKLSLNNKRQSIFDFSENLASEINSRIMLNNISKTKRAWEKIESKFTKASRDYSIKLGLREASTPLLFYSLIAWILYNVSVKNINSETNTLSIILLILYAQGPIRRTMRAPSVWKTGLHSLNKMNLILNYKSLNTIVPIEHHSMTIANEASSNTFHRGEIYNIKECINKDNLINCVLGFNNTNNGYEVLFDNNKVNNHFNLRKTIGVVSEEFSLFGENIFEILNIKNDKIKHAELISMVGRNNLLLAQFSNINEIDINKTSPFQNYLLKILRLVLNERKVLMLFKPFENLSHDETEAMIDFMISIKSSNTMIIFEDDSLQFNSKFTQIEKL